MTSFNICNERTRYVILLICASCIIKAYSKRGGKHYSLSVSSRFCQPCTGQISCSQPKASCPELRNATLSIIGTLRKDYNYGQKAISLSLVAMLRRHKAPKGYHPVNITDLQTDSKIKRLIGYKSLSKKEKSVLVTFARIHMLAPYLQLAINIQKDIHVKRYSILLNERIEEVIQNISRAACRYHCLIEKLNIKLPKRLCNYTKTIAAKSKFNKINYVISILKYGQEIIGQVLDDLSNLEETLQESCAYFLSTDTKLSKESVSAEKEPRSLLKRKRGRKGKRRNRKLRQNNKKKNRRKNKKRNRKGRKNRRNKSRSRKTMQ